MTSMHDHTPLDAVDALFELRAQMARLRDLEAELCDEIRSFATENGGEKVFGATRVAVIETRTPTRIDPAKLPHAILSDPHFFASEKETVVLLWPRPAVAQPSFAMPVSEPDVPGPALNISEEAEAVDLMSDDIPAAEQISPPPEADMLDEGIPVEDRPDASLAFELPQYEEAFANDTSDTSVKFAEAPHMTVPSEAAPAEMRTIGVPVEAQGVSCADVDLEEPALVEENTFADPTMPVGTAAPDAFVSADDPFGLKASSAKEIAMAADMPLIDAHGAVEGETPKDLRPTEHAHLQPLAGLPDEDVAQMIHETEEMLAPATLTDAVDVAQALEAQADQIADLPADVAQAPRTSVTADFEDSDLMPSTAFSSRRIAVGGET